MKFFILILFVCASLQLIGQEIAEVTVAVPSKYDSLRSIYIKSYPDHFFLWPVIKQRRLDFELKDIPEGNKRIIYKSNKRYSFGLGMYLFELSIELTFAVPLAEKSKEIYGESDARDIQVNVFAKKWSLDLYRQKYDGFYIDDPSVTIPANSPYPQRPDILTQNIGLTGNYIFNHKKFSFRSSYNFAERQLRSAGSFVLFGSVSGFKARGDSAILGDAYRDYFGTDSKIREIKSTTLSVAPGYSYSLIHKGFFLNVTLALGPSHNWLSYEAEDGSTRDNIKFTVFFVGRVSLGYAGDRFFGGLSFTTQESNAKFDTFQLSSSSGTLKILFGYRFREFGILKKRIVDLPKALGFGS
jgi:hypothetical protein